MAYGLLGYMRDSLMDTLTPGGRMQKYMYDTQVTTLLTIARINVTIPFYTK